MISFTIPQNAVKVQERIRWSDLDAAGIMYFGNYVRLFEIGETELFRAAEHPYTNDQFEKLGVWMLRVNFQCDFHSPGFIDDLLTIHTWIEHLGGASMEMRFAVCRDETLLGNGSCTVVSVDRQTKKAVKLPKSLRENMMRFLNNQAV